MEKSLSNGVTKRKHHEHANVVILANEFWYWILFGIPIGAMDIQAKDFKNAKAWIALFSYLAYSSLKVY